MNSHSSNLKCRPAEPYYYDYLHEKQDQIPEAVADHIISCSNCQHEIEWLKQIDNNTENDTPENTQALLLTTQMKLHAALANQPVKCSTVKSFLPILVIPEMAVQISTPVTQHIEACTECAADLGALKGLNLSTEQLACLSQIFSLKQAEQAEDIQQVLETFFQGSSALAGTIRKIMDRPDSAVVTCFTSDSDSAGENDNLRYVKTTDDDKNSAINHSEKTHKRTSRFKWWLKPIAAAAAIVIITTLLFQNSSVNATDIGQIYEALKSVQNVIMTKYDVDNPKPIQQISISRSRGIKLLETNGTYVLYDIKNKIKKSKKQSSQEIEQSKIDRDTIKTVTKTMNIPYGLLPFNNDSELPEGAVWKQAQPDSDTFDHEQAEVYDLFWSENTNAAGVGVHYQWRCHLNPVTKHPFKLELWKQGIFDKEYQLITITKIDYPTNSQIDQTINQSGL